MPLTAEWTLRLRHWREELRNQFHRELGEVPLSGFETLEHLTKPRAEKRAYSPMRPGAAWGRKWGYGWFRGRVVLPKEAAGRRIVLRLEPGGEGAVWVNGRAAGSLGQGQRDVTLATKGVAGARYSVLAEVYAGHGPNRTAVGPVPPGRVVLPEPQPPLARVGRSTFGIWEEEVYQLWVDVETLCRLSEHLDAKSLRLAEIEEGLRDFTLIVDFELPREEMMKTVRACRKRLKPLLDCVNGTTAPTFYAFGHSHIDVAWLWTLSETERKCVRTFSNQLALMREYPFYRFLQSQPHLYEYARRMDPELYRRIKAAVRAGKFMPEGGMWVEADTNVPSGESLIRQFVHGKRFFRGEFGVESELLWLPDVFGFTGALPQIMRGCGVRYFSTAKLGFAYKGGEPYPCNTFVWEGIDGSEVLVQFSQGYCSETHPAALIEAWNRRAGVDQSPTQMLVFGWGDGGGGPTRDHLEFLRRARDLEGVPRTRIASPVEFFRDLEKRGALEKRYVGELYYQCHRGTYTAQARTKKANRQCEFALREAELWGAAAAALKGFRWPAARMDTAWKAVLLNQFHDILPGSAIERVYQEALAAYDTVLKAAAETTQSAVAKLVRRTPDAATVFNSLSWERTVLAPLPKGFRGAESSDGVALPVQRIDGIAHAEVRVPPCGWTTLRRGKPARAAGDLRATPSLLENEFLRVRFNRKGEVTSIFDKETGREIAAGACNRFCMYKDVPPFADAWDIDSMYPRTPVALEGAARIEALDAGPLVARIRVSRRLRESAMTQTISLRRGSRRVDFATQIDWRESHKMLKVNFPVRIHTSEGVHEIQFGHLRRPNHKSRPFDADRFEVPNHKWSAIAEEDRGFALLNDCKYGVNVDGNSINLTLLKSPLAPDANADKGAQTFTYSFYVWNGSFAECGVVREAYDLNCAPLVVRGAAGEASLFSVDAPNVIVETVKLAEDGSGDVVVRLYEAKRMATRCVLRAAIPFRAATQTDMLEEHPKPLKARNGRIALDFRPFEVKTLRLRA